MSFKIHLRITFLLPFFGSRKFKKKEKGNIAIYATINSSRSFEPIYTQTWSFSSIRNLGPNFFMPLYNVSKNILEDFSFNPLKLWENHRIFRKTIVWHFRKILWFSVHFRRTRKRGLHNIFLRHCKVTWRN